MTRLEISVTACVTSGAVVSADKTEVKRSRMDGSILKRMEIGALDGMVRWADVGIDQDLKKKKVLTPSRYMIAIRWETQVLDGV